MNELTDQQLREMIQAGESDRVELKESLEGDTPTRIRQAICAFANDLPDHREPGFIIVGARDDGTFSGLSVTDALQRQLADMKTDGNILPPPTMTVEKRVLDGNEVAVVAIEPSDSPPVSCRGVIRIRIGSRRGIATAQDERILIEKRQFRDQPYDLRPIQMAKLSDLDLVQFEREYLPQAFAPEILEENDRSLTEQLAAAKMIASVDDPTPTVLGLLVLGKRTRDFLSCAYIQFLRINGLNITDEIMDAEEADGTVSETLRRIEDKLDSHNRVSVDILSGPREIRTYTYPKEAVIQIVRNAVMHRSYEGNNAPIHVYWYNDRIEIRSPGGVFGAVTVDNFGKPGNISYRNPNLAEAMKTLDFVQRFGYGIPAARRSLQAAGHPDIEFDADRYFVTAAIKVAVKEEDSR